MRHVRMDYLSLPYGVFRQVLPAARKRVTWFAVAPLLVFLLIFVIFILILEWRGILRFTRPWAFALLAFTPWLWWMHHAGGSGLAGVRGTIALLVRLALVGVFAMALAEPRAVRRSDVLSVVYALDVSDSMGEKVSDQSLNWIIQSATKKPEK